MFSYRLSPISSQVGISSSAELKNAYFSICLNISMEFFLSLNQTEYTSRTTLLDSVTLLGLLVTKYVIKNL